MQGETAKSYTSKKWSGDSLKKLEEKHFEDSIQGRKYDLEQSMAIISWATCGYGGKIWDAASNIVWCQTKWFGVFIFSKMKNCKNRKLIAQMILEKARKWEKGACERKA